MVTTFIFIIHAAAAIYAFFREKKRGGVGEGLLAVGFMALVFAVGWTLCTMLTNLLFAPEFFVKWYYGHTDSLLLRTLRKEINRDAISLLLLTFGEIAFYYFFLGLEKKGGKNSGKCPQPEKKL